MTRCVGQDSSSRLEVEKNVYSKRGCISRSEIVKRIEPASFDVQLLPMANAFLRYGAVHSDHETFMPTRG